MRRCLRLSRLSAYICLAVLIVGAGRRLRAEDWPEWRGKGRLGVWNETGIVDTFPAGGLSVTWRTPVNEGYSGPSVADGRVFVTDSRRTDNKGRAVGLGPFEKGGGVRLVERAIALDEQTGKILWTKEWETEYTGLQLVYAIGPRATPTVDNDRVYVLGTMGNLFALDVKTGTVIWQKDFKKDFKAGMGSWGTTGAPLVDGALLICLVGGQPNAKVVAFNKLTGEEVWRALSSEWEPGQSQPTIIEVAGVRQLIIWHPRAISSLNPATGKVYWEVPHLVDLNMTVATPVRRGPYLFVTSQWGGARMLKLDETAPTATLLWSGPGESDPEYPSPDSLNSVVSTPVLDGDYVYGLDNYGMLRCLHIATGKQVWEVKDLLKERASYGTAFFVRNGDRYFINNDRGELVMARLSPKGFEEISRTKLIEPTHPYPFRRREFPGVLWTHAAYANKHIIIRNDKEIVRFSLAKTP